MRKTFTALCLGLFAAAAAQAGTFAVHQQLDCPIVAADDLFRAAQRVAAANGLDLPRDMALRTELQCAANGKAGYVYTFRAAIEQQVGDVQGQRWAGIVHLTGYGTVPNRAALLRNVSFTLRDLIRQEP